MAFNNSDSSNFNWRRNIPQITLWGIVTLFFIYQFILRLSVGILRENIIAKYNIDMVAFGSLAGFYYLGYSGMQIPFGILLDKYNYKIIVALAIVITIIGTLPFIYTDNWQLILWGRFLVGAGSAAGFLSVTKVTKLYFPERLHTFMMGLSFTFGLSGAVFGGRPMSMVFNAFGMEYGFEILTFFSFILILIVLSIKDKNLRVNNSIDTPPKFSEILAVLFDSRILRISLAGGLMVGTMEGFADVWAIPFFNEIYHIPKNDSISITSFIFIGMCMGGPVLAYLIDKFKSVDAVILLCTIVTTLIFVILFYFNNFDFYSLSLLMIMLGILCCYQILIFTKVSSLIDIKLSSIATALTNCIIMSFGYFFHYIISYIMQHGTAAGYIDKTTYIKALAIIPIGCVVGQMIISAKDSKIKQLEI